MFHYNFESFTCKNSKDIGKPNEDIISYDDKKHAGIVLDGVSRDRENDVYPVPSPAQIASQIFADVILQESSDLAEHGIFKIQTMISKANQALKEYNKALSHRFPAGTVGLVFTIENDEFHYGYIGDCFAAIIRNGYCRHFTECQTSMVTKHKSDYTSDEIRFDICNHISHPCGYGVWDGNKAAMDFVKYGTIHLDRGDTILIYTDGLKEEISKSGITELTTHPLDQLLPKTPPQGADDRTCLRITII